MILKLVENANIFITNMLPDQLAKLRLDWETLHDVNPKLVYGAVSSFGRTGPDKNRGATDNLGFWVRAGGTSLLTVEGQDPLPIRQSVGDRFTGALACAGILAATYAVQASGEGRFVDTSLFGAGMWAFSTDIANHMEKGRTAPSDSRREAVMPLANYFKTRDGRWMLVHSSIAQMAPALDRPDLAEDPRWNGSRRPSREDNWALVDVVDAVIAQFDYDDLKARFEAAGVRCEPVSTPANLATDPQVLATKRLVEVGDQEERHWHVANPWSVVEEAGSLDQKLDPPPSIGVHTIEILKELGFSEEDVERMRRNRTIPPH